MKDYYDQLGVRQSASSQEIRDAYRRHAMRHHPDRNPGKIDASRFREIQEAYEVIGDPGRRRAYDESRATRRPQSPQMREVHGRPHVWPSATGDWAAGEQPFHSPRSEGPLRGGYSEIDPFTELERIAARLRAFLFRDDWF